MARAKSATVRSSWSRRDLSQPKKVASAELVDKGQRDLVCNVETVPRLRKTSFETSHGDIVGHRSFNEVPAGPNSPVNSKKKCLFNGQLKNRESPEVKQRNQRYRPGNIRDTSSQSGNIIADPPKQADRNRRRPATPTILQQSVAQENVNFFSKGGPKARPSSAPKVSSVDLLHYNPERFSSQAEPEYKSMIGCRRRMSPSRNRESVNVFDLSAAPDTSSTVLLPSTGINQSMNKSIEVRVNHSRQSAITRSSSSSSILTWDT